MRVSIRAWVRNTACILLAIVCISIVHTNLCHRTVTVGCKDTSVFKTVEKPMRCFRNDTYTLKRNDSDFVEDLLGLTSPTFEIDYKNPCFYYPCHYMGNPNIKKLRCLPYFHVLGVDKCGSTDLFGRIAKHPRVLQNDGFMGKETMWWSWKRYGFWLRRNLTAKETFNEYLANFDTASGVITTLVLDDNSTLSRFPLVTGDGTPMDFWDFSGWPMIPQNKGLTEPVILTPHLIHHINPTAKFILIFREPAERLYSDYMFLGVDGANQELFHERVEKSMDMFQKCVKEKSLRLCLFSRELFVTIPVRLYVGMYAPYLIEWLKVFSIRQFLFLRTEDYARDIKGTLQRVFSFLDLEEVTNVTLEQISSSAKAHQTRKKKTAPKMEAKTKSLLKKFYARYNTQLTELLNDKRFLWHDA